MKWLEVEINKTELDGPYECNDCGGHIMFDGTFLDQVRSYDNPCPYCGEVGAVPEGQGL